MWVYRIGVSIDRRSLGTSWSRINVSSLCPRNSGIFDSRVHWSTLDMLEWVIRGSAEFDSSLKSSLRPQEVSWQSGECVYAHILCRRCSCGQWCSLMMLATRSANFLVILKFEQNILLFNIIFWHYSLLFLTLLSLWNFSSLINLRGI